MASGTGWTAVRGENNETTQEIAVRMMVFKEARECADKINANMTNVRTLVLDLYEREGWSALGYATWRECVVKEFAHCERYLYKQLEAAQTEKNVCPMGQKEQIPERQLRPLTKLKDNPDQQREVWNKAVETAPDGKVTAAHVAKVFSEMTEAVTHGGFLGRGVAPGSAQ